MRIALDFHDVCADLKTPVCAYLNQLRGLSLTRDDIVKWRCWEGAAFSKADFYDAVDAAHNSRLKPLSGAVEGIRALVNAGHEVVMVSGTRDPRGVRDWLVLHGLPELDVVAVFSREASRVKLSLAFDIYIDDNPAMAGDHGPDLLLFDAPWNRAATENWRVSRVNGWRGVCALLAPGAFA